MKPTALVPRIALAALALLLSAGASAQTYKCLDAAGKVTYSSTACADLGLRDGGEVRDRLNTSPAQKIPPPAPKPAAAPAAAQKDAAKPAAQGAAEPERRCFKTAKGTRCNDKPEDD